MKKTKLILIVEDEIDLLETIAFNFEREGFACRRVSSGDAAIAEARRSAPDLVVLDRMLPGRTGDDVLLELRRDPRTSGVPVIMLTAKAEESDQLVGFALGADDYLTKPFSMKVLLARVQALLRRSEAPETAGDVISIGPISVDRSRHQVLVDGEPVSLTTTEFRVLKTLMGAGGRVLDREQLINMVLGPMVAVTDRTIDVHIAAVRKKLGAAANWVQTVRGVGYTFREPALT